MRILVDADACPVKDEVLKVADRFQLKVILVANGGMRPSRDPMVQTVVVSKGADAADDWIAEQAEASDIVITADIPLAQRCLEKGCGVLGPTGKQFDKTNIGMAIAMRDLNRHLRETGESKGYNKSFSPRDRSQFLSSLDTLIRQLSKS